MLAAALLLLLVCASEPEVDLPAPPVETPTPEPTPDPVRTPTVLLDGSCDRLLPPDQAEAIFGGAPTSGYPGHGGTPFVADQLHEWSEIWVSDGTNLMQIEVLRSPTAPEEIVRQTLAALG